MILWAVYTPIGDDIMQHLGFITAPFNEEYTEAVKEFNCSDLLLFPRLPSDLERTSW